MLSKKLHLALLVVLLSISSISLVGCQGDFRPEARGSHSEILVIMDSTMIGNSETYTALQHTFGAPIMTMPRPEPRFDLVFRDLRTNVDMDLMQGFKNVIIAAPIDDDTNVATYLRSMLAENVRESVRQGNSFYFPQENVWARDQLVMILTSDSDESLSQKIRTNERRVMQEIRDLELDRWHRYVYRRAEQVDLSRDILERHGWTFRIQHDYRVGVDTTDFLTLRRFLHDNDRWIWVNWIDNVDNIDELDYEWINARRDSLNRTFIQGGSEGKFVTTDFERPMEQRFFTRNDKDIFEIRGLWRMENDLMGGPFINYTMFDEENNRLYMMEYAQFSPRWDQRRFLYQFEAMARTFISDPASIVASNE